MSKQIFWLSEFKITGELSELRALMADMVAATQADEPGVLDYEWFVSDDQTTCFLYERYADSAAVLTHLSNFRQKFAGRFLTLLQPAGFDAFGQPNDDAQKALGRMGATIHVPLGGFARD